MCRNRKPLIIDEMSRLAPRIAVIGGGPSGLMVAEGLAARGCAVTVYDHMPGLGRKFLMAGRGGLNLTHSEPLDLFLTRYAEATAWLAPAISAFPPAALRDWAHGLGQPSFVGSSGRVFPAALKASPLLRAWTARLAKLGVRFALRHRWMGWSDDGALRFRLADGTEMLTNPDATVLALGGASWPRLGSDGAWIELLCARGVKINALRPANCGFLVDWSAHFRARFAGAPLKRIALAFTGRSVRGEAVITATGLEGGAVYALSAPLREALLARRPATLVLDLRPDLDLAALTQRLQLPRRSQSLATYLRKAAALPPAAIGLLRETSRAALPTAPSALAAAIKSVPLRVTATSGIERAISSAGGIDRAELDARFMLRRLPGVFAVGEMLDWEAPTGGYLLQACFSTAVAATQGVLDWYDPKGEARSELGRWIS